MEVLRGNCLSGLCRLRARDLSIAWIVANMFEHCVGGGGQPGLKEVECVAMMILMSLDLAKVLA